MSPPAPIARVADGLRARNKQDKLRRIREAAEGLFIAKGFDDTTMREIAVRAGVGLGTIFLYASNKRDLLFLTINEALERVTGRAEAAVNGQAPLIDNLLAVSKLHYEFFGDQPALSRLVLREMTFYDSGAQAAPFRKTRERLIQLFGRIVDQAAAAGEISRPEDPLFVGWTLFCIFQVELRRWLARETVTLRSGINDLERAFELLVNGLGSGAAGSGRRARRANGARPAAPGRRLKSVRAKKRRG
jgi:AcrR family transcriptional regulator